MIMPQELITQMEFKGILVSHAHPHSAIIHNSRGLAVMNQSLEILSMCTGNTD